MITRSYKSSDARVLVKSKNKVAVVPVVIEEVVVVPEPEPGRCFQPGDIVSFRSNTRGTVLAVNENGVQVDFGLGFGWFSQKSLKLVKAATVE